MELAKARDRMILEIVVDWDDATEGKRLHQLRELGVFDRAAHRIHIHIRDNSFVLEHWGTVLDARDVGYGKVIA